MLGLSGLGLSISILLLGDFILSNFGTMEIEGQQNLIDLIKAIITLLPLQNPKHLSPLTHLPPVQ